MSGEVLNGRPHSGEATRYVYAHFGAGGISFSAMSQGKAVQLLGAKAPEFSPGDDRYNQGWVLLESRPGRSVNDASEGDSTFYTQSIFDQNVTLGTSLCSGFGQARIWSNDDYLVYVKRQLLMGVWEVQGNVYYDSLYVNNEHELTVQSTFILGASVFDHELYGPCLFYVTCPQHQTFNTWGQGYMHKVAALRPSVRVKKLTGDKAYVLQEGFLTIGQMGLPDWVKQYDGDPLSRTATVLCKAAVHPNGREMSFVVEASNYFNAYFTQITAIVTIDSEGNARSEVTTSGGHQTGDSWDEESSHSTGDQWNSSGSASRTYGSSSSGYRSDVLGVFYKDGALVRQSYVYQQNFLENTAVNQSSSASYTNEDNGQTSNPAPSEYKYEADQTITRRVSSSGSTNGSATSFRDVTVEVWPGMTVTTSKLVSNGSTTRNGHNRSGYTKVFTGGWHYKDHGAYFEWFEDLIVENSDFYLDVSEKMNSSSNTHQEARSITFCDPVAEVLVMQCSVTDATSTSSYESFQKNSGTSRTHYSQRWFPEGVPVSSTSNPTQGSSYPGHTRTTITRNWIEVHIKGEVTIWDDTTSEVVEWWPTQGSVGWAANAGLQSRGIGLQCTLPNTPTWNHTGADAYHCVQYNGVCVVAIPKGWVWPWKLSSTYQFATDWVYPEADSTLLFRVFPVSARGTEKELNIPSTQLIDRVRWVVPVI